MGKPWFWNLLLLAALATGGAKLYRQWHEPFPPLPEPPAPPVAQAPAALPEAPDAGEDYDAIAKRNLFSDRRGAPAPSAPAATAAPAPAAPPPKLTLYGVIIKDSGDKVAFVQDASGGAAAKPRQVREGDLVAGAKVTEILPDRVALLFGGDEVVVPLRTPKAGGYTPPSFAPGPGARALPLPATQRPQRPTPTPRQPANTIRSGSRHPQNRAVTPRPGQRGVDTSGEEDYYDEDEEYYDDEAYYDEDEEYYDDEAYYDEDEDYYDGEKNPDQQQPKGRRRR